MPNHTTNILKVTGPNLQVFVDRVSHKNPAIPALYLKECLRSLDHYIKERIEAIEAKRDTKWWDERIEKTKKSIAGIENFTCHLDLNGTVPMPEEVKETTSPCPPDQEELQKSNILKYGAGNWYDWANRYWGTKWGAYEVLEPEREDENTIIYRFQSAWSPPTQWFITTSAMFPDLTFENAAADEGGMYYCVTTYKAGEEIENVDMEDKEWAAIYDPGMLEILETEEEERKAEEAENETGAN